MLVLYSISTCILIRLYLKFSIKKCMSNISMRGKVVIVTGANTGIGFYMAKELAMRGARVILACRNMKKTLNACNEIIKETGNHDVVFKELDLSSLASVRNFAKNVIDTEDSLHVLINNAGISVNGDRFTKDKIVEMMQDNYFAPFLLTLLLLPLLKKSKPSRIINLSSMVHFLGDIDLNNINDKEFYYSDQCYCNSKLAMLIFTLELAKRLEGSGVVANAVHPGIIFTNLLTSSSFIRDYAFRTMCFIFGRKPSQGAQTAVHLAVSSECQDVTGKYFVDCSPRNMAKKARNADVANKLWEFSKKLVGYEDTTDSEI